MCSISSLIQTSESWFTFRHPQPGPPAAGMTSWPSIVKWQLEFEQRLETYQVKWIDYIIQWSHNAIWRKPDHPDITINQHSRDREDFGVLYAPPRRKPPAAHVNHGSPGFLQGVLHVVIVNNMYKNRFVTITVRTGFILLGESQNSPEWRLDSARPGWFLQLCLVPLWDEFPRAACVLKGFCLVAPG